MNGSSRDHFHIKISGEGKPFRERRSEKRLRNKLLKPRHPPLDLFGVLVCCVPSYTQQTDCCCLRDLTTILLLENWALDSHNFQVNSCSFTIGYTLNFSGVLPKFPLCYEWWRSNLNTTNPNNTNTTNTKNTFNTTSSNNTNTLNITQPSYNTKPNSKSKPQKKKLIATHIATTTLNTTNFTPNTS